VSEDLFAGQREVLGHGERFGLGWLFRDGARLSWLELRRGRGSLGRRRRLEGLGLRRTRTLARPAGDEQAERQ
jgi:hypothetical protein